MSPTVSWTCPACREPVATPFCARCGEEPLAARELTLRGLADKLLHALTNIDARALRTLQSLVAEQLALEPTEFGDYARSFDRAVALHAKSFVVLMTVPFALLLPLVFVRRRRPFMAHVSGGARIAHAVVLSIAVGAIVVG